jgi:glycosyltransferase involved in cell wall biosynthesis
MSKSPLKVCHFSSVHHISDTRVFHRECVWLAKAGYDVTLIAIGNKQEVIQGVNVISVPKPTSRLKRILFTTRKVYTLAKQQHADVYHFHDPELIPFALLLKWSGKKVVYDIHENITESMKDKKWLMLKWLFIWVYLQFDKLAAKHFQLILAEQSYIKVYKNRYPDKTFTLVRNYAPAELLKPFIQTQRNVVNNNIRLFYMGSIDALYCCKEMLEAVAILNKQGINTHLTLVGWIEPSLKHEMQTWSFMKTIEHQVTFTGFLPIEQGYELSRNCNIGLSFVSSNVNTSQSLPRKMYEYMHIGLPVISSGYPLYKKLVDENALGICIDNNTPHEIARGILQLAQSKDFLNQLAQSSIKAANNYFNWESEFAVMNQQIYQPTKA